MVEKEMVSNEENAPADSMRNSDSGTMNPMGEANPMAEAPTNLTEDEPEGESEDLKGALLSLNGKVLRQAADFQNYRRRMEKANLEAVGIGKGIVVKNLLDVLDDLGRSLEASDSNIQSEESQKNALREGVQLVYQKFQDELLKIGVNPIEAVGFPFDEHKHEALMQQPAPEGVESGTVIQELQKGYEMGDRILRHSKVIVAS